jgi:hypothetical protein
MNHFLRYGFRLGLFILAQQFIAYRVPPLHDSISVIFYYLFILWLPFTVGRAGLILLSFITGLLMDSFTRTPGMHAAACVMIGYFRPFIISFLIPNKDLNFNYREPSVTSLGLVPYITYVSILTILHHLCLFMVQAFQFGNIGHMLLKTLGSSFISLMLISLIEIIFTRKQKFLTNT